MQTVLAIANSYVKVGSKRPINFFYNIVKFYLHNYFCYGTLLFLPLHYAIQLMLDVCVCKDIDITKFNFSYSVSSVMTKLTQ